MAQQLGFKFYVIGNQTAIKRVFENGNALLNQPRLTGVAEIVTVGSELDYEGIVEILQSGVHLFPLVIIGYGKGVRKQIPESYEYGDPILMQNDCTFVIVIADDDPRGDSDHNQTGGLEFSIYNAVGEIEDLLGGAMFEATVDAGTADERKVSLNTEPYLILGDEAILLDGITARAVHAGTAYQYETRDRRAAETYDIGEFEVSFSVTNTPAPPANSGIGVTVTIDK